MEKSNNKKATFNNVTFQNTSLVLDDMSYNGCTFINCTITYNGSNEISLHNCTFTSCSWTFGDKALNTLNFMKFMYSNLGNDGINMVNSIFDLIKQSAGVIKQSKDDKSS